MSANWQGVQQGLTQGYEIGRSTGGGRLGHLGGLIKQVADKLRTEREAGAAMGQKRDILGMEEARDIRLLEKKEELKGQSPEGQVENFKNNLLLKISRGETLASNEVDFYNKTLTSVTTRRQYEPPKLPEAPKTPKPAPGPNFLSPLFQPSKFKRTGLLRYEPKNSVTTGVSEGTDKLIEVTNLQGKRVNIKENQLSEALKQGYKR